MKYSKLVELYEKLNSTTKMLEMTAILADFLKNAGEENIERVVLLTQGIVFPKTSGKEIGVASSTMIKAISRSAGVSEKEIKNIWRKTGDLGDVAQEAMKKGAQEKLGITPLTISKFVENLDKASQLEGMGTVDRKIGLVSEIISSCNPLEAKYAVRTILGIMRLGVGDGIVRDALASATGIDKQKLERAYHLLGDYGKVTRKINFTADAILEDVKLSVFNPIKSMLQTKVETIEEGFKVVGKPCLADVKYDGMRAQIHYDGKEVKIFTRRLEDVTKQFPEIVGAVKKYVDCDSCILDSEAVGYRDNKPVPFQQLSRRIKRKYDIDKVAEEMPTWTFVFDCLEYNGESLMDTPFEERRKIVEKIIKNSEEIQVCEAIITDKEEDIEKFLEKALKQGHEGLMMKSMKLGYQPGRRIGYGVKLKPGVETLDLVVVKAIWGEGKRTKWLSSYVLACRDGNEFKTIGKMSSGPTEEQYEEITNFLRPLIEKTSEKTVTVEPKLILEIGYQEIQKSPKYESGFALRFPILKNIRYDKPLLEVDDIEKIKNAYNIQSGK